MEHEFTQEKQVGNWKVLVSPSTNYGYFENQISGTSGGLWFKGRMVVEYDGIFELPNWKAHQINRRFIR